MLWANLHLLFWLSLIPFATGWMGENHFAPLPVAVYGGLLIMAAIAYTILMSMLVRHEGAGRRWPRPWGGTSKGKLSLAIYAAGVGLAFVQPFASIACYVLVALIWFVPDRRMERAIRARTPSR